MTLPGRSKVIDDVDTDVGPGEGSDRAVGAALKIVRTVKCCFGYFGCHKPMVDEGKRVSDMRTVITRCLGIDLLLGGGGGGPLTSRGAWVVVVVEAGVKSRKPCRTPRCRTHFHKCFISAFSCAKCGAVSQVLQFFAHILQEVQRHPVCPQLVRITRITATVTTKVEAVWKCVQFCLLPGAG